MYKMFYDGKLLYSPSLANRGFFVESPTANLQLISAGFEIHLAFSRLTAIIMSTR